MKPDLFIKNFDGQKMAVYDIGDKNHLPVVFIHGNSLGAFTFKFQNFVSDNYRFLALDLPGHGNSENANKPDTVYPMKGMIKSIEVFIETLKLKEIVFVGHSFGGHLLIEGMGIFKEYAKALMIFGTPPLGVPPAFDQMYFPSPVMSYIFKDYLMKTEMEEVSAAFLQKGAVRNTEIIDSVERADPLMRKNLGTDLMRGNFINELEMLTSLTFPVAILHGENDQLVNCEYFKTVSMPSLWRNKIQLIRSAGHCSQFENSAEFNSLLSDFLAQINS